MRRLIPLIFLILPSLAMAEPGPLFMKHLLGDREFFEPWGIGFDFYTMDQQYDITSLSVPGIPVADPSVLDVRNEVQHYDLKLDVWLTPFLNVFGLLGKVDADTVVDLSDLPPGTIALPLKTLPFSYDGTVYGAGFTLAYGTDRWFTSLTSTWTDTDLGGDFDSSVKTMTAQPRIGLLWQKWSFYVGGMYLDTEETHSGTIDIPGLGALPFYVELEGSDKWNTAVGAAYVFSPKAHLSLELGFGKRDHTVFNFTYRF